MAEYHGATEAEQRSGPEVVKRQRVAKEQAVQRVCSWTMQNEIREVSWGECPQALQEGFSILPILERYKLNRRLCPLQRRRERTQRA